MKERNDIVERRKKYCKDILEFQNNNNYQIIFLDESYVCKNHCRGKSWKFSENFNFFKKPSGKGTRIVMTGAITENGWLKGSFQYWVANSNSDYHKNFNSDIFYDYMKTHIIPQLKSPSVVVLDNAPYHFIMERKDFNPNKATKVELQNWLTEKNIKFPKSLLQSDLKKLCNQYWDKPKNILEEELKLIGLKNFGLPHILLYLPPYHPELNPIELCWARMKNFMADNPCYKIKKIKEMLIPNSEKLITPFFCQKIYKNAMEEVLNYIETTNSLIENDNSFDSCELSDDYNSN